MSLLMEALRKAEEAKRKVQQESQQPAPAPVPEAAAALAGSTRRAAPAPGGLQLEERDSLTPDFIRARFASRQKSDEVELTPDDLALSDPRRATTAELESYFAETPDVEDATLPQNKPAGAALRKQQMAAASVFNAKQPRPRSKATLWLAAAAVLLLLPIGGGLYWYLQQMNASAIGFNPAVATYDPNRSFDDPPPAPAVDTAAAAPAAPDAGAPAAADPVMGGEAAQVPVETIAAAAPEVPAEAAPGTAAAPAPEPAEMPIEVAPVPPPAATAPSAGEAIAAAPAPASGPLELPTARAPSLQVSRSEAPRQANPQLTAAYARLQAGDHAAAALLYEEVLRDHPNNRDALLGLASADTRNSDFAAARARYARLLQLNPRDALARAGLLETTQSLDPVEHEAELRALLVQYPDVAQISFALGNLYAAQERWSEAQSAYFDALLGARRGAAGPINPDYAFNLAVSLERLNQRAAALDYYRQARDMARDVTPGFDMRLLESRLSYLEQNPQ